MKKKINKFNYIQSLKQGSAFARYLDKAAPKIKFDQILSKNDVYKRIKNSNFPVLTKTKEKYSNNWEKFSKIGRTQAFSTRNLIEKKVNRS